MPFANNYNKSVANKVIANAKRDIATKDKMYDDPASFVEPHSQQEYQTVQHPEVVGGSGNLAATSYDRGEEPKKVGGTRINKARAVRVAKPNQWLNPRGGGKLKVFQSAAISTMLWTESKRQLLRLATLSRPQRQLLRMFSPSSV